MFHPDKTKVAIAILHESKSTPELFLRRCCEAGITNGNRDTQDELWEFDEYVLSSVPSAIHALRDSLIYELCRDDPKWKYSVILNALIRSGNYKTSEALSKLTMDLLTRNDKQVLEQINNASKRFSLYTKEYRDAVRHAKICGDRFRVQLAHAASFCYVCDNRRLDRLWTSNLMVSSTETLESDAFEYQYRRFLNTHIGLFGLDRRLVETPRRSQWLYRYRLGTWAALAEWIVRNTPYDDLGKFWDKSLADTLVINTTDRVHLSESKVFISGNNADWERIARVAPGFYRQYNEAKAKLDEYK